MNPTPHPQHVPAAHIQGCEKRRTGWDRAMTEEKKGWVHTRQATRERDGVAGSVDAAGSRRVGGKSDFLEVPAKEQDRRNGDDGDVSRGDQQNSARAESESRKVLACGATGPTHRIRRCREGQQRIISEMIFDLVAGMLEGLRLNSAIPWAALPVVFLAAVMDPGREGHVQTAAQAVEIRLVDLAKLH